MSRKKQTILILAAIRQSMSPTTPWAACVEWAVRRAEG